MKGSEFFGAMSNKTQSAWDALAYQLAQQGSTVSWPWIPIPITGGGHTGTFFAASDMFAVGDPSDFLRLPVFPSTAQRIANLGGFLLPTPKMARAIFAAGQVSLKPTPMIPNKFSNLEQYVDHNGVIQNQLHAVNAASDALVVGHSKDVVIDTRMPAGKVIIYGWFDATKTITVGGCGKNGTGPCVSPEGYWYIQPLSSVHGADYVDYSQLYRFVRPDMIVDGQTMALENVLRDKELSKLLSDSGPLSQVRYPTPGSPAPGGPGNAVPAPSQNDGLYALGVHVYVQEAKPIPGA